VKKTQIDRVARKWQSDDVERQAAGDGNVLTLIELKPGGLARRWGWLAAVDVHRALRTHWHVDINTSRYCCRASSKYYCIAHYHDTTRACPLRPPSLTSTHAHRCPYRRALDPARDPYSYLTATASRRSKSNVGGPAGGRVVR
jgi:hypothetical protein